MQDHGVLAESSVFESIVYAGTWLPYPMKPFELVLSVRWVDLVQARNMPLKSPTLQSTAATLLRGYVGRVGCRRP